MQAPQRNPVGERPVVLARLWNHGAVDAAGAAEGAQRTGGSAAWLPAGGGIATGQPHRGGIGDSVVGRGGPGEEINPTVRVAAMPVITVVGPTPTRRLAKPPNKSDDSFAVCYQRSVKSP